MASQGRGTPIGVKAGLAAVVAVGLVALSHALSSGDDSNGSMLPAPAPENLSPDAASGRLGIIAGCENSGGLATACECMADQTIASGYDTTSELTGLEQQMQEANRTGDTAGLPPDLVAAYRECAERGS